MSPGRASLTACDATSRIAALLLTPGIAGLTLAPMTMPDPAILFWGVVWIASVLAGLLYFAPLGYQRGQRTAGGVAVIVTILLGPLGVAALVPWAFAHDDGADSG